MGRVSRGRATSGAVQGRLPLGDREPLRPPCARRWIADELAQAGRVTPQLVDERVEYGAWIVDRTHARALALAEVAVCIEERSVPERIGTRWLSQRIDRALARHARARGAGLELPTHELAEPLAESVGLTPRGGTAVLAAIARMPLAARRLLRDLARGDERGGAVRGGRLLAPLLVAVGRAAGEVSDRWRGVAPVQRLEPFEQGLGERLAAAGAALAFIAAIDAARRGAPEERAVLDAYEALQGRRDRSVLGDALAELIDRQLPADSFVRFPRPRRAPCASRLDAALERAGVAALPLAGDGARIRALLEAFHDLPEGRLWRVRADYAEQPPPESARRLAELEEELPEGTSALRNELAALWLDAGEPAHALEVSGGPARGTPVARAALEGDEPQVIPSVSSLQRVRSTRQRDPRRCDDFGASALRVVRFRGLVCNEVYRDPPSRPAHDESSMAPELEALVHDLRAHCQSIVQTARGALDPEARWMSFEPILDDRADCLGAVVLEWRHGLIASLAARRGLAAQWATRVLDRERPLPRIVAAQERDASQLREATERAVEELGLGLAHRRWSLLALRGIEGDTLAIEPIAGGGAAPFVPRPLCEAEGVALAVTSASGADVGRDPARLALHRGPDGRPPASGIALRTSATQVARAVERGHGVFVFVLESTRRGDLGRADLARLRDRLEALHPSLDFADLGAFADAAPGPGSCEPQHVSVPGDPGHAGLARSARRIARAGGPAAVHGPLGSGRAAFASWVTRLQRRRRALEGGPSDRPSTEVCMLDHPPRELAARGALPLREAVELSARSVAIPGLADARHRVPGLVQRLTSRTFEDSGLAELWRADLPAGLVDLRAVLTRLEDAASSRVDAREVRQALVQVGLEPRDRWPSRGVSAREVASALWCTRTQGGRVNRSRAALWLGWDPETLRARQAELALDDIPAALRSLEGAPACSPAE